MLESMPRRSQADNRPRSACPISQTLELLGDRWTLLIIRDLLFFGRKTFGELLESPERIATNILASRLRFLEEQQLVEKTPFPGSNLRNLYGLTPQGESLLPVLLEIIVWGERQFEVPEKIRLLARQIRTDRAGVMKKITRRLSGEREGDGSKRSEVSDKPDFPISSD